MKSSDGEHVATDLPRVAAECRGDSADGQAEFEAEMVDALKSCIESSLDDASFDFVVGRRPSAMRR